MRNKVIWVLTLEVVAVIWSLIGLITHDNGYWILSTLFLWIVVLLKRLPNGE